MTPPPVPRLPSGFTCRLESRDSVDITKWSALVGTLWGPHVVRSRLRDSVIPCLYDTSGALVATCVFRPDDPGIYLLETLVARPRRKGYGGHLLHAGVYMLYGRVGPHSLVYAWELNAAQLIWTWMRGWMASMISLEYGWITTGSVPDELSMRYSDSGLGDGIVHMSSASLPAPGHKKLWMSSSTCPGPGWSWTGEFIVIGGLNKKPGYKRPFSPYEISPGYSS